MTSLDYQVLSRRIYSNFPVIGWLLRRWAAWQLAKDEVSGEAVAILAEVVTRSQDRAVREMAVAVLSRLKNKKIIDEFCKKWMENPNGLLENIIRKKSYEPNEVSTKALFYFLLGSWQKYEDLDFDQRLLTKAYYAASENTQKLVADKAKKAGRIEWIQILTNTRQGFNAEKMTDKDWIDFVDILAANPDRKEIWRFLYNAPVIYSKKLLDRLVKISYKWFREDEEIMVKNLLNLSAKFNERDLILNSFLFLQEPMYHEILDESFVGGEGRINSVAYLAISPDGRILVSVDGTISLWGLPNGNHLKTLNGHTHAAASLAISPNGHILASGFCGCGTIGLWSLPDGNHLKTLKGHKLHCRIACLAISPDDHILASGSHDGTIRLWSLPDGNHLKTLKHKTLKHPEYSKYRPILSLAISPDGCILAEGSYDTTIRLWSLPDGNCLKTLEGHTRAVECLAISPDGRILASGSRDGTIRLWSLPNGNHLKTLEGNTSSSQVNSVECLAISPNGHILASGSYGEGNGSLEYTRREAKRSGSLDLWSLPDGNYLKTLSEGDFECLAISNHILASGFKTNGISSGRKGYSSKEFDSSKRPITTVHLRLWSLFNSRYINMPLSLITNSDISKIKSKIEEYKIDEVVRSTFEFNLALIALRKQFDIDIEDSSNDIHFSEFDIEIDG